MARSRVLERKRPESLPDEPRFYDVAQASELLRVSEMTVYRDIRDGRLPAIRVTPGLRGRLVIPAQAIEEPPDTDEAAESNRKQRYFKVAEVSRFFGVGTETLRGAIRDGEFPGVWVRKCLLVPAKAINEMVATALKRNSEVNAADWVQRPATGVAAS